MPKSHVIKRSVIIAGHKTSVSIEDAFWAVLKDAAGKRGRSVSDLVGEVDSRRAEGANLSSCLRLFALDHVQTERRV